MMSIYFNKCCIDNQYGQNDATVIIDVIKGLNNVIPHFLPSRA